MTGEIHKEPYSKKNRRSRLLFFIWNNAPRVALILFIVVICLLFGTIGEKKAQLEAAKKDDHVEHKKLVNTILLELQPTEVDDSINLPGTIEPWTQLSLLSKVSGAITEVLVEEGDTVKQGELLARIEEDDYRIALDAAQAAYRLAVSEFRRNQAMLKKKVIPKANFEESENGLKKAKADLERAQLQLSRCSITAPIAGVIRRFEAKTGAYLGVGDPIGEILQIEKVKAVVGIPESDVDAVRRIDNVDLTIQALAGRQFTGRAHFLSPAPETTAYLYRFELALDNQDHEVLPGMFFRAYIVKKRIKDAVMVPLYSVVSRGDRQYVYIAEGDMVKRRAVELGIIDQWMVQVTKGLQPGDKVLIEGHRDVEEGQRINIVKTITDPTERLL